MASKSIPNEIKQQVEDIVKRFNEAEIRDPNCLYIPRYRASLHFAEARHPSRQPRWPDEPRPILRIEPPPVFFSDPVYRLHQNRARTYRIEHPAVPVYECRHGRFRAGRVQYPLLLTQGGP